jgi:hypothetical protein
LQIENFLFSLIFASIMLAVDHVYVGPFIGPCRLVIAHVLLLEKRDYGDRTAILIQNICKLQSVYFVIKLAASLLTFKHSLKDVAAQKLLDVSPEVAHSLRR